jgi:hypothetical protein
MLHERVHESEWNWVGANFNYTIENKGTIQDLGKEVEKVLQFIR